MAQLCQDFTAGSRLRVELDARGDLSRLETRMVLLGVLCFDSALPWGGRVLVCRTDSGWRLVGEATRMRPQPDLWGLLDADLASVPMPAPADVHFALLGLLARSAGRTISWEQDDCGAEISF